MEIAITDHLEGPAGEASGEVYEEVAELVELADELGVNYALFAEHHAHAHQGHLPSPLMYALHLAGRTKQIRLGAAIVCLNLHHPLDVAEQAAVADVLMKGRLAPGFGSGSTPDEHGLFGVREGSEAERHARFEQALERIVGAWNEAGFLPKVKGLEERVFLAANSVGAARIAGRFNFNMLYSHLRTPEQYRAYRKAYEEAGGRRKVAANRPVFVGRDDATAFAEAEPALRLLWRRFQREGKIAANVPEPETIEGLCAHPINFIVGGPGRVREALRRLQEEAAFEIANLEFRWAGLSKEQVRGSLRRFVEG